MLITLEGLDGSGKTSAWESLRTATPCRRRGLHPRTDGTWYGEAVERSIGDDDADPLAELFLYTADHHAAHLADTVRPALAEDRVVVSDRYSRLTVRLSGRNSVGRPRRAAGVRPGRSRPWTRPPDATVYLDVDPGRPPNAAAPPTSSRRPTTSQTMRENYERLIEAEPDRFVRVDASQSQDDVQRRNPRSCRVAPLVVFRRSVGRYPECPMWNRRANRSATARRRKPSAGSQESESGPPTTSESPRRARLDANPMRALVPPACLRVRTSPTAPRPFSPPGKALLARPLARARDITSNLPGRALLTAGAVRSEVARGTTLPARHASCGNRATVGRERVPEQRAGRATREVRAAVLCRSVHRKFWDRSGNSTSSGRGIQK